MIEFCEQGTFNETKPNGAKQSLKNTGQENSWIILW
jgi:hypothetical protein